MKTIGRFFLTVLALMLVSPLFMACGDDEIDGCGLTVVVKDATNASKRLTGAQITISKEAGDVRRTGTSDVNGEAYFFLDNEVIFDIDVTYSYIDSTISPDPQVRRGKSTVRLKYNETITKDVLVAE